VLTDPGAAEGPVVVGVHEARRQHPAVPLDDPVGVAGCTRRHVTQLGDAVALDQHVPLVRLGQPVTVHDDDVCQQLANRHDLTVPVRPIRAGIPTRRG